jgi:AraC-like DNA-binding protein
VEKPAAMLSLNAAYFGTLFNRETGTSVNRYIARIRIRNAENILRSGVCRVTEAAEQCGYSDMCHTSRISYQLRLFQMSDFRTASTLNREMTRSGPWTVTRKEIGHWFSKKEYPAS